MSVILMTTKFYKALILQGEIWCWSLLGFKGLMILLADDLSGLALIRLVSKKSYFESTNFSKRISP